MGPADRLDFHLCGELKVFRGNDDLPLRAARQGRLALAYLVLNHDRVVTRDELMERVATEPDPELLRKSLSETLSRLRRDLGSERLERLPAGAVRLRGPVHVDVLSAKEALRSGRQALRTGDWAAAAEASQAVLTELTGEVLAGDEADWLEDVRRKIADVRVDALELRATAALRTQSWTDAVEAARAAATAAPTRESACSLLLEAHAGSGDVALATQAFHAFRRRLMDETGLTPSADLTALHDRLLEGGVHTRPTGSVALPPALSLGTGGAAFVGRERVLALLRARLARAREGVKEFVALCGEPGIGKTRVAGEFARGAYEEGAIVLYGRSDAEPLVPYQPFVTAIGQYVSECADGALARELGLELSELSRLIPGLARRMPELREPLAVEPEIARYRLYNAVTSVLAFIARERPVVLILDDLHWADPSTAVLLRHTVDEIADVRLLILGTFRDREACHSDELADLLARAFERVPLAGLHEDEIAALVMARQGRDATKDAVSLLRRATGGNPLLLEETLRVLAEAEPSGSDLSAPAVRRMGLPAGAKHVIERRLAGLSAGARRVLTAASVVGVEFGVRVLAAVGDDASEPVIAAVEEAEDAGLVRDVPGTEDRYAFSHALVREALLEGQTKARRQELHHRIGEALESLGGVAAAELAHHFTESRDPRDAQRALRYSLEAGRRARETLAHEDAAGHFRAALELVPPGDDQRRCEVLLGLGSVQLRQGSDETRRTFRDAFELARRNGLPNHQAQAALGFASRYTEAGVVDAEDIALLEGALSALGHTDAALRVELTARLADSLHFAPTPGEAMRRSEEALELAQTLGDPHTQAVALESRHAALLSIEHLADRLRLSEELVALAQREREPELEALGRHWRIYDLLEAADMVAAERERRLLNELADELRQPLYQHFAVGWDVVWAHLAGRVDQVEPLAMRFYDLGIKAQARDTETIYRAQIIALRRREERLPEFVSTVRAAVEAHPTLLAWRAVLPLTHLAAGDPAAAAAEFEWFAHDGFSRVRRDMFWFTTISVLAETCAWLRDAERATDLYDLLEPFADHNVQAAQAACWGSARRFLGLLAAVLGRWGDAVAHLEAAIDRNEACGNPAAASLVRRDLARMLMLRGRSSDLRRAAELLQDPLRAARAAGAAALAARIEAEMAAVEQSRQAAV